MTIEEQINQRIKELEAERDRFVADANAKLGQYQAVIAELRKLLEVPQNEVSE